MSSLAFKLYDFKFSNETSVELKNASSETLSKLSTSGTTDHPRFTVQLFGKNQLGESVSITTQEFRPFLYAKVSDDITKPAAREFVEKLEQNLKATYRSRKLPRVTRYEITRGEKLYGFDNHSQHTFLFLEFANLAYWKSAKGLWYEGSYSTEYSLRPEGYLSSELYEIVPPELRFFHLSLISPSGWIQLEAEKVELVDSSNKKTSCTFEYIVNGLDAIKPLLHCDDRVPWTIASFDGEMSSKHGDFPLPTKTYQKLAASLVDITSSSSSSEITTELITHIIECAFFPEKNTFLTLNVDEMDTKMKYLCCQGEEGESLFQTHLDHFFQCTKLSDRAKLRRKREGTFELLHEYMKKLEGSSTEEEEESVEEESFLGKRKEPPLSYMTEENTNVPINKKKTTNLQPLSILTNSKMSRKEKVYLLTAVLDTCFHPLKGDHISQIGTVFSRYGDPEPYLKHVCVLNEVTPSTEPNTVYQKFDTEAELLLGWRDLIVSEDPDFMLSYNGTGFDWEFFYQRSQECGCVREFLTISKNTNEMCGTNQIDDTLIDISRSSTTVASGTYELSRVNMPGRVEIDLLVWFRREEKYNSFTLDFVSHLNIGDTIRSLEHDMEANETCIVSRNLYGLYVGNFVRIELITNSSVFYKGGFKFQVTKIDRERGRFWIDGIESPSGHVVRWGLSKDDVGHKDIFRLNKEGPDGRAIVSKYCLRDCELVLLLLLKVDVLTTITEMSGLCCVPMSYLLFRGQGIKLTSYIGKQCWFRNVRIPALPKCTTTGKYEGAIVLEPKSDFYLDDPVNVGDYASLYPSSMISENLCPSSKVTVKDYNLTRELVAESGLSQYDNLPTHKYVDVEFMTYTDMKGKGKKTEKVHTGYRICRYATALSGKRAIMPAILEELLSARKATKKLAKNTQDPYMKNVLDKRQLSFKLTANSVYGGLGARTGSFYEPDIAASTTAVGRMLLLYAKRVVEECYTNHTFESSYLGHTVLISKSEYVYGDTDSVFFKFTVDTCGRRELSVQEKQDLSIEIAVEACSLVSSFLKPPHDFEYEKTFFPFCLLTKKRYFGILVVNIGDTVGVRKDNGNVLARRDNAPIVKDIFGGIGDILLRERNLESAIYFLQTSLKSILDPKTTIPIEKFIVSKALRGFYVNPKSVAHKVLADRIGERDPGNRPMPGDRIPYVYIHTKNKQTLQGNRIESPEFVQDQKLKIDYAHYVTNQILKPVAQLLGTVLPGIMTTMNRPGLLSSYLAATEAIRLKSAVSSKWTEDKLTDLALKHVQLLLFDPYLHEYNNRKNGQTALAKFQK